MNHPEMINTENAKPNVIVICGPTALGKTSVSIELAGVFNAEIVGADSMQVYRYMDIGTAKPTPSEQSRIPHHMIDIVDPDEHFDARRYAEEAAEKIRKIVGRGDTPFIVGGTGLYIKALVHGLFEAGPADSDVRQGLKKEAENRGIDFLYRRLKGCDPVAAARIHPNDTYRIIRALEIYQVTGKAISDHHRQHRFKNEPFTALKVGLNLDREQLYRRIDDRVDVMIETGLLNEVKELLGRGYPPDLKSMQSIGYRHMVEFIQDKMSWDQALQIMKRDTRRYAKRQLTWFRADPEIVWYRPEQLNDIRQAIEKFMASKKASGN